MIAATNRDLQDLVSGKQFREDLFFRLSVFPIHIPPLRERMSDVRLLANYFLEKFSRELHCPRVQWTDEALRRLEEYSWPGNVRELQNCVERAVILCDGTAVRPEDLTFAFKQSRSDDEFPHHFDLSGALADVTGRVVRAAEKVKIHQTLELCNWNRTQAAELLQVSYKTLLNKVKEYGLEQ